MASIIPSPLSPSAGLGLWPRGLFFLTIVTKWRKNIFGEVKGDMVQLTKTGRMADNEWLRLACRFKNIQLHNHVVMPNHIHGIIVFHRRGMADLMDHEDSVNGCHALQWVNLADRSKGIWRRSFDHINQLPH